MGSPPSSACFHCGLPIPPGAPYPIHTKTSRNKPVARAAELAQLGFYVATSRNVYDLPEIQKSFVRVEDEHIRDAALMQENIVCAARAWRGFTLLPVSASRQ